LSAHEEAARGRRQVASVRTRHVRLGAAACLIVGAVIVVGIVFAGSPARLGAGIKIAGVPVGGLAPDRAIALLQARSDRLQSVPLTFTAGSERFSIRPEELDVKSDWQAAVEVAAEKGDGFAVLRGYKRLALKLRPLDIEPHITAYDAAVAYEVGQLAAKIDRPHVEATLVRHGLEISAVHGQTGQLLDRVAATQLVVESLAGFSREPVELPVQIDRPSITVADLARTRLLARRVLSAPVALGRGSAAIEIPTTQLAKMLQLPAGGLGQLVLGGRAADAYFSRLDRKVRHPPRDASFRVDGANVTIVPSHPGLAVDVPRTAASVLAAAERRTHRVARLAEAVVQPARTTAEARGMGITGLVGSYETFFGGIPNRIHNVELVAHLIDGKLVAPGATFSFNETTGARTAEKGFVTAPVIINGELQTALGGGVCQVSTTTFNAAYEAGLPITARTNHALYISHYPLGRDATVNYPDTDLKFVNDTSHWMLVRTFVTYSSLVVSIFGAPQHRRVESETAPLRVVKPPPLKKKRDKTLKPGEKVVDDPGVPATSTWVRRRVYSPNGKLLYDSTWYSNYVASPKLVRIGPKKKPAKPATKQKSAQKSATPASG
jgi:vancomycin resistance protein YoaR